jgi:DNA primase
MILHQKFDKTRLPDPEGYYSTELGKLRGSRTWRSALCPFHEDTKPSLRVNVETGSYRCFACCASGGDVLDFQRQRYGQTFPEAVAALGAWIGGRHV